MTIACSLGLLVQGWRGYLLTFECIVGYPSHYSVHRLHFDGNSMSSGYFQYTICILGGNKISDILHATLTYYAVCQCGDSDGARGSNSNFKLYYIISAQNFTVVLSDCFLIQLSVEWVIKTILSRIEPYTGEKKRGRLITTLPKLCKT